MPSDRQEKLRFSEGPETETVSCLGRRFPDEASRRAYYRDELRKALTSGGLRDRTDFPDAEVDRIVEISDPPYFTACPNPFLADFVRYQLSGGGADQGYARQALASDVRAGKGDRSYYVHSYHTKVPPSAVSRFVEHYADAQHIVLDSFAGSGMTGLGSALADLDSSPTVLLGDLSPAAAFISYFHTIFTPTQHDVDGVEQIAKETQEEFGSWYTTIHNGWVAAERDLPEYQNQSEPLSRDPGIVKYTVWSEVVACPNCGTEVSEWAATVSFADNAVADTFFCETCDHELTCKARGRAARNTTSAEPVFETRFDRALGEPVRTVKRVPVLISYEHEGTRYEKWPDSDDTAVLEEAELTDVRHWFPRERLPAGDKMGDPRRAGIEYVHQFHSRRMLHVLAYLRQRLSDPPGYLGFLTSILNRCTWQNRYMPQHRDNRSREVVGPLSGTLYIPSFAIELNPIEYFTTKSKSILRQLERLPRSTKTIVTTQSADNWPSSVHGEIDYVFVDPPFGSNLQYSELNAVTEAWLGVRTAKNEELVVNDTRNQDLRWYESGMRRSFATIHDLLKPGRWTTIIFHNSKNAVWNAIQTSVSEAGLVVADVRILDKMKGTTKQLTQANSAKQDLIISAYRPRDDVERSVASGEPGPESVWTFIAGHLQQLPTVASDGVVLEVIVERQSNTLYDRMVAFHVQIGRVVPMGIAEFLEGLSQRFPERDGMYFLPEQVPEYDRKRAKVSELKQLDLFVTDEASAIQWIRQELSAKPQTFQDLQPEFMQELQAWAKHERTVELKEILEQNFLRYDGEGPVPSQIHSYLSTNYKDLRNLEKGDSRLVEKAEGRWYVPDPNKQGDLEKLRERTLLKEFEQYKEGKKKLKEFRTEAVRAGFKAAYDERDYETIVSIAKRLPESVLQEDEKLLMYYDVASMRLE